MIDFPSFRLLLTIIADVHCVCGGLREGMGWVWEMWGVRRSASVLVDYTVDGTLRFGATDPIRSPHIRMWMRVFLQCWV